MYLRRAGPAIFNSGAILVGPGEGGRQGAAVLLAVTVGAGPGRRYTGCQHV